MDILPLITVLVSGAIGGNLAGQLMPRVSMGRVFNSLFGIIGGGLGGYLFDQFGMTGTGVPGSGSKDVMNILTTFAGGCLSGGTIMLIIGYFIKLKGKKD
ncbi:MAG: hypothetical protein KGZ59_02375 [Chitinophagaceae bacterium]|nr:hypothetical protein [Chitinophagaceae bacterium]